MPGHPDWAGTALVHGADNIVTNLSIATPVGQYSTSSKVLMVAKPGYLIHIGANYGGGSPTKPLITCEPYWYDPTGAWYMGHERWVFAGEKTNVGNYKVIGTGPTKGSYVQFFLSNNDPSVAATTIITLVETTQHLARDDWRALPEEGTTLPEYTLLPNAYYAAGNYLANSQITVNQSATNTYLLPLYAGPVSITVAPLTATASQNWSITDALTGYTLYAGGATAAAPSNAVQAVLGRHSCLFNITNTSASAAFTSDVVITALEYST